MAVAGHDIVSLSGKRCCKHMVIVGVGSNYGGNMLRLNEDGGVRKFCHVLCHRFFGETVATLNAVVVECLLILGNKHRGDRDVEPAGAPG